MDGLLSLPDIHCNGCTAVGQEAYGLFRATSAQNAAAAYSQHNMPDAHPTTSPSLPRTHSSTPQARTHLLHHPATLVAHLSRTRSYGTPCNVTRASPCPAPRPRPRPPAPPPAPAAHLAVHLGHIHGGLLGVVLGVQLGAGGQQRPGNGQPPVTWPEQGRSAGLVRQRCSGCSTRTVRVPWCASPSL